MAWRTQDAQLNRILAEIEGRFLTVEKERAALADRVAELEAERAGSSWAFADVDSATAQPAGAGALTTLAIVANTLYAVPFVAPRRGGSVTHVLTEVTTGVAGSARVGIYDSRGDDDVYPDKLIQEAGAVVSTTAVAVKASQVQQVDLDPGELYWLALVSDVAPTWRARSPAGGVMGVSVGATLALRNGLSIAFAYAALPTQFPASATAISGDIPLLALRFAD